MLLCFTSLTGAQPLYAIPANTQLPTGPNGTVGTPISNGALVEITHGNNQMTITQNGQTSVLEWGNFSIGADATVNFVGQDGQTFNGLNSLNYVKNGGPVSEIYGQLNALGGNIFIANPAGVQIGNSAQINVGSLYVTNKDIGKAIEDGLISITKNTNTQDITSALQGQKIAATNAELMSLGSIISTENKVTFDGGRIVIDTDRLYTDTDGTKMRGVDESGNPTNTITGLTIKTTDTNEVVLGYDGAKDGNGDTTIAGDVSFQLSAESTPFDGNSNTTYHGYQWIRDLFQLQDIADDDSLDGWYALRNSIEASYTDDETYKDNKGTTGKGFNPIGDSDSDGSAFTGRFDGLGYDIFGLNIKRDETNVGLFGFVDEGAYVRNFTLNSGRITGKKNVGAAVGNMTAGSVVENIINAADVKGEENVGGIIGLVSSQTNESQKVILTDLINIGTVEGNFAVGGIVGTANYTNIGGTTYNLGNISGISDASYNIGGIVGYANNVAIGNAGEGFQIYNQASVTGGYNVGGIAGYLSATNISDGSTSTTGKSTIQNAANHGKITATGSKNDAYSYHTADTNLNDIKTSISSGVATVGVKVANAGGIVGTSQNASNLEGQHITISNVLNDGDVSSSLAEGENYHIAGNVGGIAGSANDTAIEDATNRENSVAGAHNVGGIAGLLTGKSHITNGTNDGGDITGTGARLADGLGFAYERIRGRSGEGNNVIASNETFIIGNIGGVAGYLYDTDRKAGGNAEAYIENSTNRGTVHSAYITDEMLGGGNLPDIVKAANVGGVAGKVDSGVKLSIKDDILPANPNAPSVGTDFQKVSIRHSYNTGEVQGYTGVGGIAGMMYNGSVARSFNTGKITSTRQSNTDTIEPLNMGGIVGDTTELTDAATLLYDVYNAGQIGDETYEFYGRHVGGIAGRLSGEIYKAYNTGDIYNGFSVTGGIVGWWHEGNITYVFNTGNVTALNNNATTGSYVGGIVGAADSTASSGPDKNLSYAYNLGTIRSFARDDIEIDPLHKYGNYVSGIIGAIERDSNKRVNIDNVYTLGNIYAAVGNDEDGYTKADEDATGGGKTIYNSVSAVWNKGTWGEGPYVDIKNVYYIAPEDGSLFTDLSTKGEGTNFNKAIAFYDKSDLKEYSYIDSNGTHSMTIAKPETSVGEDGKTADIPEDENTPWRLYSSTPILNVFMPYAEDYFSQNKLPEGVTGIQYGTAYNPLLTIINTDKDITLDWNDLQITGAAGLAVYGGGLTLTNFQENNGYYYGGTIYSDGALKIEAAGNHSGTFTITDGARLYGSSVEIDTNGNDALISGTIQATGNDGDGSVTITSGKDSEDGSKDSDADIEILGQLISAKEGDTVTVDSITSKPDESKGWRTPPEDRSWEELIRDPEFTGLPTYAEMYEHTTGTAAATNGDVTVETAGSASILYGNMEAGAIRSYGDFNVTAGSGIYLDSVMDLGRDLNLTSDGEIILDFASDGSISHIHDFVNHFNKKTGTGAVNIKGEGNFIIGLDMWNDETSRYDITKFNKDGEVGTGAELQGGLDAMKVQRIDEEGNVDSGFTYDASKYVYLWVEDAYQLKGIQDYVKDPAPAVDEETFLGYNFALKDNIDASVLTDFESIGTGTEEGFSGIFDGRGFRILGLNAGSETGAVENAGIFTKIAGYGTVRDLRVYASNFYGTNAAGAIAGENDGTITGVTTLGNYINAAGVENEIIAGTSINGAAGGVAGINNGRIQGVNASDMIVVDSAADDDKNVVAGGIAGVNAGDGVIGKELTGGELVIGDGEDADDYLVTADSAVTATGGTHGMGGAIGVNIGTATLVNSTGVTNGKQGEAFVVDNLGGVVGENRGAMVSLYNESIVMGKNSVGGVAGVNSGRIENAINTVSVTGEAAAGENDGNVGGIAGVNSGTITSGRNAGTVTGGKNTGGMVGTNAENATLQNLSNALVASINGTENVGGIAGTNAGTIESRHNLVNEGSVTGTTNVGGVAGTNEQGGVIENVLSDTLVLNTENAKDATNFGGIAGVNNGTITNATNDSDVTAEATNVGGIAGLNRGKLEGSLVNNGSVSGNSQVGGLAGTNTNDRLLQGTADDRLIVTNNGKISAVDGSAGGIFHHNNKGDIEYANLTNTGTVIGTGQESTGGLFGINSGNISHSTLTNSGTVEGGTNTGGLIGKNSGDVSFSSLINEYGAEVTGGNNTGGLIGYNTGTLTGGRGTGANGMTLYKYQIYNNGAVSGTDNVGGLIGHNAEDGALYAGYNTGAVKGNDSVGGIAGQNDGSVSSVFNTIMTGLNEDGTTKYGAVTGKTNVGGLVGFNAGTLTDGYNTTGVESGGTKGNIAGSNSGEVENVYATNNDKNGMLIGTGNGTVTNGYNYDETKKDSASYEGFFEDGNDAWRIYEGYSTPLLRVFLTDAKYERSTNQFTYNANMQGIKDLQKVTAADGLNGSQISSIAEVLLTALEQKNAGTDYLAFSSTQIAANNSEEGFNPNNLGYDIDATFSIGKLLLSVKDIIASIVYGGSKYEVTGGVLEGVIEGDSVDIDVDFADMSKEELDKLIVEGSEYDKSKGGRATADVLYGDDGKVAAYENSLLYNGSLSLTGNDADNYALAEDTTVGGSITVEKAKLNVELGTVERTYGNTGITTEGGYKVTDSFKQHLVNGDKNLGYAVSNFNVTVAENGDTALTGDSTGRVTKDANLENESYYWTAEKVSGVDGETLTNLSKNYDIVVNGQGKSIVNKAPLSITLKDVTRIYGDAETFVGGIGYGIDSVDGLVNGDEDYENALKLIDGAFENELIADSGLLPNGWTNDANDNNDEKPNYTWTVKDNNINAFEGIDKLSQNYTLTVNEGESFVEKLALTISDVFATIVYGDQNGTGFKIAEGGKLTGIVYDDDVSLSKELKIEDAEFAAGGSYESSRNGRTTADAGIYDNETLTFSDLTLSGTKAGNYTLNKDVEGDIVVKKAVLTLTPDNATTTYGTAFDENSYSYTLSGVTNDDEENALRTAIGVLEYGNDAAFYGEGGKYTADADTHNNAVYIKNLNEKMLTNYNVVGDKGAAIITKATLDVALNPVERTYGDTTLTHGDYSINTDWLDKLVNGDELMYTGDEISISGIISDKAVIDEYTTNDAGGHSWSAKVNTSALAQNYNINEIAIGSSIVNKAKLIVNAGHAETTYGTPFDKNKYYYDLVGVTNGDAESEIKAQIGNVAYDNTAAIEDGGDRVTDNAGVNGVLSILTDLFGIELGNYEIEKVNDGTATVEKADLFITAHDKHTHVGREPEYTGTTLGELELVNGDTLADFSYTFGIEEASMLDEAGHYAGTIAAVVDGQYYYDGTHDWSAHHDVFANYKVNVEAGNLTVVRLMPTIPHYNYSWLYDDAPYGRKWNFRERKAEIYFQDGGMAYDENM